MWCISDPCWRFCRYVILAHVGIPAGSRYMSATFGFVTKSQLESASRSSLSALVWASVRLLHHDIIKLLTGCSCAGVTDSWGNCSNSLERTQTVLMTLGIKLQTHKVLCLLDALFKKNMHAHFCNLRSLRSVHRLQPRSLSKPMWSLS